VPMKETVTFAIFQAPVPSIFFPGAASMVQWTSSSDNNYSWNKKKGVIGTKRHCNCLFIIS
jgi:hypothetical protein